MWSSDGTFYIDWENLPPCSGAIGEPNVCQMHKSPNLWGSTPAPNYCVGLVVSPCIPVVKTYSVPVPATFWLLLVGVVALAKFKNKRAK
jgi:hypothetical protein